MAETDWTPLANSLEPEQISRGRTTASEFGIVDGSAAVGFHSLDAAAGLSGFVSALVGFAPIANRKGGIITALVKKHAPMAGGAPLLFFVNSPDALAAEGYILGLTEEWPYSIALKRGMLSAGLKGDNALAKSSAVFSAAAWLELALYVTVNTQNDIVLRVLRRDPVLTGAWAAVPGIDDVIDDAVGLLTGTPPVYGDFYPGFGHYNSGQSGRVSLFDHITIARQTAP